MCGLGLATVNLSSVTYVSIYTHYEDMKGDKKCGRVVCAIWFTTWIKRISYY